jgi:hypothetical protein
MAIEENSERGRVEEGVLNELRTGHRPSLSLIATHDYLADRRGKVPFAHHALAEEPPPISATRPSGAPRVARVRGGAGGDTSYPRSTMRLCCVHIRFRYGSSEASAQYSSTNSGCGASSLRFSLFLFLTRHRPRIRPNPT